MEQQPSRKEQQIAQEQVSTSPSVQGSKMFAFFRGAQHERRAAVAPIVAALDAEWKATEHERN